MCIKYVCTVIVRRRISACLPLTFQISMMECVGWDDASFDFTWDKHMATFSACLEDPWHVLQKWKTILVCLCSQEKHPPYHNVCQSVTSFFCSSLLQDIWSALFESSNHTGDWKGFPSNVVCFQSQCKVVLFFGYIYMHNSP